MVIILYKYIDQIIIQIDQINATMKSIKIVPTPNIWMFSVYAMIIMSQSVFLQRYMFLYLQAWGRAFGPVWWGYGTYPQSLWLKPGRIVILSHPESAGTDGSAAAPEDQNISHTIRPNWNWRIKHVNESRNNSEHPFTLKLTPHPFILKSNVFLFFFVTQ